MVRPSLRGSTSHVLFLYPFHDRIIRPEAVRAAAEKAEVAAVLGDDELDAGVRAEHRRRVDIERDEGVVLGLNQKRGNADGVEIGGRGLRAVIVFGIAEAEGGSGEAVVELHHGAHAAELLALIAAGGAEAVAHAADETRVVEAVIRLGDAARAGREIP